MTDDLRTNLLRVIEINRAIVAKTSDYIERFGKMDRPTVVYINDASGALYVNAEGRFSTILDARAFPRSAARKITSDPTNADYIGTSIEIIDAMRVSLKHATQTLGFAEEALTKLTAEVAA